MGPTCNETDEITEADSLQYPYNPTDHFSTQFQDTYKRKPHQLLASLSLFCHLVETGQVTLGYDRVTRNIPTLSRFMENLSQPQDFNVLLETFPPARSPKRHIFHSNVIQQNESDILALLQTKVQDCLKHDQIAFPHCLRDDCWVVFFVLPQQSAIEVYSIGRVDMVELRDDVSKLCRVLRMAGLENRFQIKCRLQIPVTFPVNPVVMTFILVRELHNHGKYLDLNEEMIMRKKLFVLTEVIAVHDQWLGQLKVRFGENKSHPFITLEYEHSDKFDDLEQLGWQVVDVEGDGNCGYYSFFLGLENNGEIRYYPTARRLPIAPMQQNKQLQSSVIRFRKELQDNSQFLLNNTYPRGNRTLDWFFLTTAITDDEIDDLTEWFYTDRISQKQYFDGTLKVKPTKSRDFDYSNYQMNPYWSSLVVSSRFNMRVIVYTRIASWDKTRQQQTYSWSTTTMNATLAPEEHMVQVEGIAKLSDMEYQEMPTIEILYTTGFIDSNTADSQHFQFLRRVICDNVPNRPIPSTDTIKDYLQRVAGSHKMNMTTAEKAKKQPVLRKTALVSKGKTIIPRGKVPRVEPPVTKHKREKKWIMDQWTDLFDQQYQQQTSKHKTATRMKYDAVKQLYLIRMRGTDGKLQRQTVCRDIDEYDKTLITAATQNAGEWVGPSVGDCGAENNAPMDLCTDVKTLYEQHGNRYCLTYSLASAIFYCGFKDAAMELAGQAPYFAGRQWDEAMNMLRDYMLNLVPVIGRPTLYGIRTGQRKLKRYITWNELLQDVTPYPTLVVPRSESVNATHAFCIVDDLIFDSTTPYALKLQKKSVDWLFNGAKTDIEYALRFNMKCTPKGVQIKESYKRRVTYHWDHPSRPHK